MDNPVVRDLAAELLRKEDPAAAARRPKSRGIQVGLPMGTAPRLDSQGVQIEEETPGPVCTRKPGGLLALCTTGSMPVPGRPPLLLQVRAHRHHLRRMPLSSRGLRPPSLSGLHAPSTSASPPRRSHAVRGRRGSRILRKNSECTEVLFLAILPKGSS